MTHASDADGGGMSLTTKILIAMGAGIVTGVVLDVLDSAFLDAHLVGGLLAMIGTMFVNALKMLVVPLVVFSLIGGVMGIGDIRVLGRVGGKSLVLYVATTAIAIAVAIVLASVIGPGRGFDMTGIDTSGIQGAEAPTVWNVFANIVPTNPVAALANGRDAADHLLHRGCRRGRADAGRGGAALQGRLRVHERADDEDRRHRHVVRADSASSA